MFAKLLPRLVFAAVFAFLLLSLACQQTAPPNNQTNMTTSDAKAWDSYLNEFLEAYFVARPDFAVRAGRHEFDGKLPDWSADGLAKEIEAFARREGSRGEFSGLRARRATALRTRLCAAQIDNDLFWLESAEWPYRNPQFYADAIDPDVYVSRPYAPLDQRLRAYTAYAKAIPAALEQIRKNLRTPLPKTYVQIGTYNFRRPGLFL